MLLRELALFLTAIAVSATLTWLIWRRARARGLMDIPNARSSHTRPTPRGGGLAIVVTILAAALLVALLRLLPATVMATLAIGGGMVAAIGYYDDLTGLSAMRRFVVQLVVAIATISLLTGLGPDVPLFSGLPHAIAWSVLVISILWTINLFNFMDGIDGIAGSQAAFVSTASALLIAVLQDAASPWLILPVVTAGACLGFLAWNWPPARIFMGDVGSGFLGYWLAAMALVFAFTGTLSLWTSTILGSVFIADATVTLLRRVVRRERWYEAHCSHAYQNLARRWESHRKVTVLLWILNLVIVLPLAASSALAPQWAPQLAAATLGGFGMLALLAGAGATQRDASL